MGSIWHQWIIFSASTYYISVDPTCSAAFLLLLSILLFWSIQSVWNKCILDCPIIITAFHKSKVDHVDLPCVDPPHVDLHRTDEVLQEGGALHHAGTPFNLFTIWLCYHFVDFKVLITSWILSKIFSILLYSILLK